jgi:hypothetical protein
MKMSDSLRGSLRNIFAGVAISKSEAAFHSRPPSSLAQARVYLGPRSVSDSAVCRVTSP